ncbi:HNH endonuclease [Shewanella avicenniae]|uniref:HNH endonuclease n=1 Tax=Shewanella avicenniae TaxID=2814294 RepID=A0ABX7QS03_9GAMM|nr:HNH endonuclease signature motif containing protein [Shewanella avicenniae]QSX34231.1 HNH endonuclease [Shewanella avicenniae]
MELQIEVTLRDGTKYRTRKYKSELSAKRGIFKWLEQHQHLPDISASYFSPELRQHQSFDHPEQLQMAQPQANVDFYQSSAWRKLRLQVLQTREHRCAICNRTQAEHNIAVEVDHIKPRSKYPELALALDNLQILCLDCNRGKADDEY